MADTAVRPSRSPPETRVVPIDTSRSVGNSRSDLSIQPELLYHRYYETIS